MLLCLFICFEDVVIFKVKCLESQISGVFYLFVDHGSWFGTIVYFFIWHYFRVAQLGPCQMSMIEIFSKNNQRSLYVNYYRKANCKSFFLDVVQDPSYASVSGDLMLRINFWINLWRNCLFAFIDDLSLESKSKMEKM